VVNFAKRTQLPLGTPGKNMIHDFFSAIFASSAVNEKTKPITAGNAGHAEIKKYDPQLLLCDLRELGGK
jgi:hypothetical protein